MTSWSTFSTINHQAVAKNHRSFPFKVRNGFEPERQEINVLPITSPYPHMTKGAVTNYTDKILI